MRSYVLFMGPAESDAEWNDQGVEGVYRFLGRVWRQATDAIDERPAGPTSPGRRLRRGRGARPSRAQAAERALLVKTNQVIQKTTADVGERFRFNTALAAIMELSNDIGAARASGLAATATGKAVLAYALETMVRLLEPFAPHMGAELWEMMGRKDIWDAPWPEADARFLARRRWSWPCRSTARCATGWWSPGRRPGRRAGGGQGAAGRGQVPGGRDPGEGSRGAGAAGQPGGEVGVD